MLETGGQESAAEVLTPWRATPEGTAPGGGPFPQLWPGPANRSLLLPFPAWRRQGRPAVGSLRVIPLPLQASLYLPAPL